MDEASRESSRERAEKEWTRQAGSEVSRIEKAVFRDMRFCASKGTRSVHNWHQMDETVGSTAKWYQIGVIWAHAAWERHDTCM